MFISYYSDNGNNKIKDMHLLKSLQRLLREESYETKDVMDILSEVKTPAMINQGFKLLVQKCKNVSVLNLTVDEYLQKFCDAGTIQIYNYIYVYFTRFYFR